jgi:peptidoglycan-associated lipoprotein
VALDNAGSNAAMMATNRTVYFDYDSFVPYASEFQSVIEAHAKFLKGDRSKKVAIEGHTDERGGREYNLALGQKRAEAVRRSIEPVGCRRQSARSSEFWQGKTGCDGVYRSRDGKEQAR